MEGWKDAAIWPNDNNFWWQMFPGQEPMEIYETWALTASCFVAKNAMVKIHDEMETLKHWNVEICSIKQRRHWMEAQTNARVML